MFGWIDDILGIPSSELRAHVQGLELPVGLWLSHSETPVQMWALDLFSFLSSG